MAASLALRVPLSPKKPLSCACRCRQWPLFLQACGLKLWKAPPDYGDVEFPEERRLRNLEKTPQYPPGVSPPKMMKDLATIRGPELVHNKLLYNQYGIITLCGGFLRPGHIDMIRLTINKKLETQTMFAVWRIDPPWKPITKKLYSAAFCLAELCMVSFSLLDAVNKVSLDGEGQGKRMGKGKGSIDHYVTPVKAGRIIVEMGGHIDFEEVKPLLQEVCYKLPVDAIPISQEVLDNLRKEEEEMVQKNINPFSIERVIDYQMQGSQQWISKYDKKYYTKYI